MRPRAAPASPARTCSWARPAPPAASPSASRRSDAWGFAPRPARTGPWAASVVYRQMRPRHRHRSVSSGAAHRCPWTSRRRIADKASSNASYFLLSFAHPMHAADEPHPAPASMLRTLADDLDARREQIRLGGGEEKIAAQHAAEKLTARERLALLYDDGHLRRARDPRPSALLPARDGGQAGPRRRRDHRLRQGRRPARRRRRVRLHGDGRLDGDDRRAQGHAPARAGAEQAHPDRSGCSTPPAHASRRPSARCSRAPASCSGRRS